MAKQAKQVQVFTQSKLATAVRESVVGALTDANTAQVKFNKAGASVRVRLITAAVTLREGHKDIGAYLTDVESLAPTKSSKSDLTISANLRAADISKGSAYTLASNWKTIVHYLAEPSAQWRDDKGNILPMDVVYKAAQKFKKGEFEAAEDKLANEPRGTQDKPAAPSPTEQFEQLVASLGMAQSLHLIARILFTKTETAKQAKAVTAIAAKFEVAA